MLHDRPGMMVRNRPIVLTGGDYLLPIYHETGENTEEVGADSTSLFLRRDQKTGEWKQTGEIRSAKGNIQPAVVEVAPGRLIAYCRRGGGYGPTKDGWMVRAESSDGGWTWTEGRDSAFQNPERRGRLRQARERRAAPRVQRQHVEPHAARRRALTRQRSLVSPSPGHRRRPRRLRLPHRLPGQQRPHPRRLHLRPPPRDQPRNVRRKLDREEIAQERRSATSPSSPFTSAPLRLCALSFCASRVRYNGGPLVRARRPSGSRNARAPRSK